MSLSELWLSHNALGLSTVISLVQAPALRNLVIARNPCYKLRPAVGVRRGSNSLAPPALHKRQASVA